MPYFHTPDNTRLFYIDTHAGRPMVFVASAWLNARMWELQIPYFADRGFRCIACDRRGHGRSDCPWTGYDYDTLSDDLNALSMRARELHVYENAAHGLFVTHADRLNEDLHAFCRSVVSRHTTAAAAVQAKGEDAWPHTQ